MTTVMSGAPPWPVLAQLARLQPRRVHRSAARRLFERRIARRARTIESQDLVTLGSAYGGWTVPADSITEDWICYCVGAGSDVSFDLALIETFGCRVWCADPGEDSERLVLDTAARQPRLSFARVALAPADGVVRMFRAADPQSSSLSAMNLQRGRSTVDVPGRSLPSLMAENGHAHVDLLKLDIEGAEYPVLESLDLVALGVRVLCVELHRTVATGRALALVDRLRRQGFVAVSRSGADYTFLRAAPRRSAFRTRTATRGAGAVAVGYAGAASVWCGSIVEVVCTAGVTL
jgi:FkbM family methyltransferase